MSASAPVPTPSRSPSTDPICTRRVGAQWSQSGHSRSATRTLPTRESPTSRRARRISSAVGRGTGSRRSADRPSQGYRGAETASPGTLVGIHPQVADGLWAADVVPLREVDAVLAQQLDCRVIADELGDGCLAQAHGEVDD